MRAGPISPLRLPRERPSLANRSIRSLVQSEMLARISPAEVTSSEE